MPDPLYTYARPTDVHPATPEQYSYMPTLSSAAEGYLPTPNSAVPKQMHLQQQQARSQHPSPQKLHPTPQSHPQPPHQYAQSQHYPQSPHHEWSQAEEQAGPSSYRRNSASERVTPASMASGAHSRDPSVPGEGRRHGDRRMMDGDEGDGRAGVEDPFGERSYTELKCLGDGSFGTVWLCDWHSPVKPDTLLSAMQCGAGARPEWAGKRLVALKRMKRVWEGGWQQAKNLGELVSLRRIPPHPAVIPLYDAFISPKSRELYFVFECMEGNLYQLTKSRRGRPLAAGLIASCFHQISSGLFHIHQHGYFHRDMKPENLLVTTTGLTDYLTAAALSAINSSRISPSGSSEDPASRAPHGEPAIRHEKDVSVIVKLADFGLARATASKPPYTEYVSTRWYRAPEVLLRSTEYGAPVDMWALGTILAEMVNLKPLFPGVSEIDQVYRICDTLGDPSAEYGVDDRGRTIGGGSWNTGIKLAKNVGFSFPKRKPVNFRGLFNENVPQSLIDCIADLLRYNPRYRLTSAQCIEHPYFHETLPHLQQTSPLPRIPFSQGQPRPVATRQPQLEMNVPPRQLPPSHSHHEARPAFANGDMRNLPPPVGTPDNLSNANGRMFFPPHASHGGHREDGRMYGNGTSALVHQLRELDLPTDDLSSYGHRPSPAADAAERTKRAPSSLYDGSTKFEASLTESSNPSYANFSSLSVSNLHISDRIQHSHDAHHGGHSQQHLPPKPHVAAYVQQQQQQLGMYEDTPRIGSANQIPAPTPPPIETPRSNVKQPSQSLSPAPPPVPPATLGKKKKWGLSSVFGSSEKHLPVVEESGYQVGLSSSLKRTQSGNHPEARMAPLSMSSPPSAPIEDPKKAKKEAERQARELEKAKREAAERAQKERARAVMRKREQLIEAKKANNSKTELEFGDAGFTRQAEAPTALRVGGQAYMQPPIADVAAMRLQPGSSAHVNPSSSSNQLRSYSNMPGSQSVSSVRSHGSALSGHSQLSASALAARDRMEEGHGGAHRHKARRRDEDDDHSMSSFDVNSLRSRSVLTVGTIDSDPGPRRGHQWTDPADPAARRQPSLSGFRHHSGSRSRLMSGSNPSLDSQLAHDFGMHANLASGSSSSLGRHAASHLNLHDLPLGMPPQVPLGAGGPGGTPQMQEQGQGSAPTSPYGHPKGLAVAHGIGMGRHAHQGQQLPSISDWQGEYAGQINPMFRVPPSQGLEPGQGQKTTLPPFSAIASVADAQAQRHNQGK